MSYEIKTKVKIISSKISFFKFTYDRDKAHKVFVEAIKCNYDNWKVWENFLWVCLIKSKTMD